MLVLVKLVPSYCSNYYQDTRLSSGYSISELLLHASPCISVADLLYLTLVNYVINCILKFLSQCSINLIPTYYSHNCWKIKQKNSIAVIVNSLQLLFMKGFSDFENRKTESRKDTYTFCCCR